MLTEKVLQRAEEGDVEAVFSLYEARVAWMDRANIRQWNVTGYLDVYPVDYYRERQRLGQLFVLRGPAGELLGAVVLLSRDGRWPDSGEVPAYYIHNLVTDPGAKGAGRLLLARAEELARADGKKFLRLDCAVDNRFLNQYYEEQGFVFAGNCEDGLYKGNRREKAI